MKLAVVKPDYNIYGGFEVVVDKIIHGLQDIGYTVDYIKVDMTKPRYSLDSLNIPPDIYYQNQEFFRYILSIQEFEKLDLSLYDIVITTQPPSFAINHRNVICLFYHHIKIYYDLYEVYLECGFEQKSIHERAKNIIREIDNYYITNNKYYLAGSKHVASRLIKYNNIDINNISIFTAGIDDDFYNYNGPINYEYPVCVGRHEFPKRPELFIKAMKHIKETKGRLIGQGGRTEDLKKIDKYLSLIKESSLNNIDGEYLWKKVMFNLQSLLEENKSYGSTNTNVIFTGRVSKKQLIKEYANALCVVCPSYEEDYGLTAIEAMAFRKPVIACKDGGGYLEFIKDGKNGFIVEPTGEAIAEKIKYLKDNPDKLREMGQNAFEFSRKYSWDNAIKSLNNAIQRFIRRKN